MGKEKEKEKYKANLKIIKPCPPEILILIAGRAFEKFKSLKFCCWTMLKCTKVRYTCIALSCSSLAISILISRCPIILYYIIWYKDKIASIITDMKRQFAIIIHHRIVCSLESDITYIISSVLVSTNWPFRASFSFYMCIR